MTYLTREAAQSVLDALNSAMVNVYDQTSNAAKRLNPAITVMQAAIDAPKQEPEIGPCRQELHNLLNAKRFDKADFADMPQAAQPQGDPWNENIRKSIDSLLEHGKS